MITQGWVERRSVVYVCVWGTSKVPSTDTTAYQFMNWKDEEKNSKSKYEVALNTQCTCFFRHLSSDFSYVVAEHGNLRQFSCPREIDYSVPRNKKENALFCSVFSLLPHTLQTIGEFQGTLPQLSKKKQMKNREERHVSKCVEAPSKASETEHSIVRWDW